MGSEGGTAEQRGQILEMVLDVVGVDVENGQRTEKCRCRCWRLHLEKASAKMTAKVECDGIGKQRRRMTSASPEGADNLEEQNRSRSIRLSGLFGV